LPDTITIDVNQLDRRDRYHLMISSVIPRPIAWTSTISRAGITNLAPFSFFGGVSTDPPIVMLSIGRRRDGSHKDTARNLLDTAEAVVHICPALDGPSMVATSADLSPTESEFDSAGLPSIASSIVAPPRLERFAIAMETRRIMHSEVGNGPVDLFLLEAICFHLRSDLVVDGLVDASRLAALGRLGGSLYCDTARPFSIE